MELGGTGWEWVVTEGNAFKKEAIWHILTAGRILATSQDLATNRRCISSCFVGYESFNWCRLSLSQTAVFELMTFVSPKADYSGLKSFDSSFLPLASRY